MPLRRGSAAAAVLLCAASALAACGGSGTPAHARDTCPQAVASALGPGTRVALSDRAPDVLTCVYRVPRAGGALLRMTLDTAPQARTRFERAVVERGQAYLGAPRARLPQELSRVGDGAAWIAAERELLATAHGRLVTVTVLRPAHSTSLRAMATAAARAALGR
jgi:hypothetical protein